MASFVRHIYLILYPPYDWSCISLDISNALSTQFDTTGRFMKKQHKDHIKKLEELMKQGKDFSKMADYFLTHLGEDRSFTRHGKLVQEYPDLEFIAQKLTGRIFQQEQADVSLFLIQATGTDFYHGFGQVGKVGITLIFFEKSGVGLLIIPVIGADSHYFRFTMGRSDGPALPYYGPPIVE